MDGSRWNFVNDATRKFQLFMLAMFIVAFLFSILSTYDNLSSGIIWGSILSFFSILFVILSYYTEKSYQRHPNPLIFWRAIADFVFVIRLLLESTTRCSWFDCEPLCNDSDFQCGCSQESGASDTCIVFAGILEFSLVAAECWFVCMSINLYVSLTNPFTDFKRNMKYFHLLSWGSGAFLAILLMVVNGFAGYSELGFCWTNTLYDAQYQDRELCPASSNVNDILMLTDDVFEANYLSWIFFYMWMVLFLGIGIGVYVWAWTRLSQGLRETYAVRMQSIHRARFYVACVTIYWLTLLVFYILYLTTDAAKKRNTLYEFTNFLLACKGYVDFVVWFSLNDFRIPSWKKKRTIPPRRESLLDLGPQVNAALRKEVIFYTTSGIVQAVQGGASIPASQNVQHLSLMPQSVQGDEQSVPSTIGLQTFHDYSPHDFRRIRERFGVLQGPYVQSLSTTAKERLSEGASGAFMFFSGDSALIVKSTTEEESKFLRTIVKKYADYLCSYPETLLTRFYGCHCLELYGKKFHFVVMANLFDTDQIIHYRYDIKGSWVNRNAGLPKSGKKVTCRHCNRKYVHQSTAYKDYVCTVRLGGHEPNVVLKDNDLTHRLRLDESETELLYLQLVQDSNLLCSFGIMDYSLLIGVHDVEYMVSDPHYHGSSGDMYISSPTQPTSYNPFSESSVMEASIHEKSIESNLNSQRPKHTTPTPAHQQARGGMRLANTVVGAAYYHLGVIDILQTWTLKKRVERYLKIQLQRVDGDGLSAIEPQTYKVRFQAKMADILGIVSLQSPLVAEEDAPFEQQNAHMDIDPEISSTMVQKLRAVSSSNLMMLHSFEGRSSMVSPRDRNSSVLL